MTIETEAAAPAGIKLAGERGWMLTRFAGQELPPDPMPWPKGNYTWCRATLERPFACTRKAGHKGRHAAGDGERIYAVWAEPPGAHTSRTVPVHRACNGCGIELRPATEDEADRYIFGAPLPDVRQECPRCSASLHAAKAALAEQRAMAAA